MRPKAAKKVGAAHRLGVLGKWAHAHPAVLARCAVDVEFRMRVLDAGALIARKLRPGLVEEADAWERARGARAAP